MRRVCTACAMCTIIRLVQSLCYSDLHTVWNVYTLAHTSTLLTEQTHVYMDFKSSYAVTALALCISTDVLTCFFAYYQRRYLLFAQRQPCISSTPCAMKQTAPKRHYPFQPLRWYFFARSLYLGELFIRYGNTGHYTDGPPLQKKSNARCNTVFS